MTDDEDHASIVPCTGDLSEGDPVVEAGGFSGRILLVEDEDFTRTLVTDGLNLLGVETLSVNSIAAAMEALKSFDPILHGTKWTKNHECVRACMREHVIEVGL